MARKLKLGDPVEIPRGMGGTARGKVVRISGPNDRYVLVEVVDSIDEAEVDRYTISLPARFVTLLEPA